MPEDQNSKPQKLPQDSKPLEMPRESKVAELNDSFAGKSQPGDQGISLKPAGSHATNPFTPQDVIQPQSPTAAQPESSPPSSAPVQADTTSSSDG